MASPTNSGLTQHRLQPTTGGLTNMPRQRASSPLTAPLAAIHTRDKRGGSIDTAPPLASHSGHHWQAVSHDISGRHQRASLPVKLKCAPLDLSILSHGHDAIAMNAARDQDNVSKHTALVELCRVLV